MSEWWTVRLATPLGTPEGDRQLYLETIARGATQIEIERSIIGVESIRVGGQVMRRTRDGDSVWQDAYLANPVNDYQDLAHIAVSCGDTLIADGQCDAPIEDASGAVSGVEAMGYAAHLQDAVIQSENAIPRQREELIALLIRTYCPLLSIEAIPPLGGQMSLSDCDGLKVSDVLDQIARQGDDQGNEISVTVLPGRVVRVRLVEEPAIPDYHIAAGSPFIRSAPRQSAANIVTDGAIRYTLPGSTTELRYPSSGWVTNPFLASRFPRSRQYEIPGGVMTATGARFALMTYLRSHSSRSVSYELTIPFERLVDGVNGPVHGWQMHPGEYVAIGGRGPWPISRARINVAEGVTQLTVGTQEARLERFQRLFINDQNRTRRINVATGGRERNG